MLRSPLLPIQASIWPLLLLASGAAMGQVNPAPASQPDKYVAEAQTYIGRALFLRGFYGGSELEYDSSGRIKGSPKVLDWTLAGMDMESATEAKPGELELNGIRVAIRYNQEAHTFDRHPLKVEHIRIRMSEPPDDAGVKVALRAIFSTGIDPEMQRSMPEPWEHYFLPTLDWSKDSITGSAILKGRLPAEVSAPEAIKKAQPDYTADARQDKVAGTVTLQFVVDTAGMPQRIMILKPLGYGLDTQAANALRRWRFKPALQAGTPVAVEFTVNQQFELVSPPQ